MLKRNLDNFIASYYKESRNALLLTGARQTGKTFAIRKYGQTYKNFIEINFIEHPEAISIFESVSSAEELIMRISLFAKEPLVSGDTLIFFDEIQKCPEILTGLKFLVDDGKYRYILSGSLLGVEFQNISSQPVGYMGIKEVFPLCFKEFLQNLKISDNIINSLEQCFHNEKPVDEVIHRKLLDLFRLYLIVGGMPGPMWDYIRTNDLSIVIQNQTDIVSLYKRDISQYSQKDSLKIKEIFDLIPSELDAKNKRFILKNLNEHAKYDRYADSFLWLKDAGVAIPVYNVNEPKVPLRLSETRNLFKLFSNDVGLLAAQYADGIQRRILAGDTEINYGSIYENAVAQELLHNGLTPYYYNNKRRGEIDFIVSMKGKVLPIEVKSGKDYTQHSALMNFSNDFPDAFEDAYILCNGNVSRSGKLLYLPIYMLMFIEADLSTPGIYKIDLTGLQ